MTLKIDSKDTQILTELDLNARIPLTQLAKKVKLSVQVVKYRIERLEKKNIIQQYYVLIDTKKLGNTIFTLHYKFQHLSTKDEEAWMQKTNKIPEVLSLARITGNWDFAFPIIAKDYEHLNEILIDVNRSVKANILNSTIMAEKYSTYYNMNLFHNRVNFPILTDRNPEIVNTDEIDKMLIKELSVNCRQSLVELGQKINLSPNGVKDRIRNLEKKGIIIGYKAKINYELLGFLHFRVLIHLKNPEESVCDKIEKYVGCFGNVESSNKCLGYDDLNFRCYVKSIPELQEMIRKVKDEFTSEVIHIETVMYSSWESMKYV